MPEHTYKTLPTTGQEKVYRCKVVGDAAAILQVGSKHVNCHVRETSGSGFTVGLEQKLAKKIKLGQKIELRYEDRRILVMAKAFVESVQGEARLMIETIREFEPKERWAFRLPFSRGSRVINHESGISSGAAYGGFVLVIFCVMSLPGIGDKLGTAPRIETALKMMGRNFADVVQTFRQP